MLGVAAGQKYKDYRERGEGDTQGKARACHGLTVLEAAQAADAAVLTRPTHGALSIDPATLARDAVDLTAKAHAALVAVDAAVALFEIALAAARARAAVIAGLTRLGVAVSARAYSRGADVAAIDPRVAAEALAAGARDVLRGRSTDPADDGALASEAAQLADEPWLTGEVDEPVARLALAGDRAALTTSARGDGADLERRTRQIGRARTASAAGLHAVAGVAPRLAARGRHALARVRVRHVAAQAARAGIDAVACVAEIAGGLTPIGSTAQAGRALPVTETRSAVRDGRLAVISPPRLCDRTAARAEDTQDTH